MSFAAILAGAKGLVANWQYTVMAALLAWGGLERMHYLDCKAGRAADKMAQAEAIAAFQRVDAERTRMVADARAAEVARLKGEANARETAITRSTPSMACLDSPAARAFIDSLPASTAGAGAAPGARRAGQAVPR